MPEVLAVVRSVEGQFGRVKDYNFPRVSTSCAIHIAVLTYSRTRTTEQATCEHISAFDSRIRRTGNAYLIRR